MTEGFGLDQANSATPAPAYASGLTAGASADNPGHGGDAGAGPGHGDEVRVDAGSLRWERPTAHSFWRALGEPEQQALAASGVDQIFRPGSVLCHEGEPSSQVMIIRSGWAKVSVRAGAGEQIVAVRGAGDVVGERALLAEARTASVTALDQVRAMTVTAARFTEFLTGHPRAAEVLAQQVRERREEDRVRFFPGDPAAGERRLAWLLYELAQRRGGYQQVAVARFTLPMSQRELADWAGVSTDAVTRFLRSWRERGIVRTDRRQLTVLDLDELSAICGDATTPSAETAGDGQDHEPDHGQDHGRDHGRDGEPGGTAGPARQWPAVPDGMTAQPGGRPADALLKSSPNCSILVVDVARFGDPARNDGDRLMVRQALYDILRWSFEDSGVPWAACPHEDRGDGVLFVVPPAIATARFVDPLLAVLAARLGQHNRRVSDVLRIQLRAALHVGPVGHDGNGLTGQALITASRIVDAPVIKVKLAESAADLVFAVSAFVYEHVIVQGLVQVDPATFEKVECQVKESRISAWIHLAYSGARGRPRQPPPHGPRVPTGSASIRGRAAGSPRARIGHPERPSRGTDGPGVPGADARPVAAPFGRLPANVRGRREILADLRRPLSRVPWPSQRTWVIAGMGGLGKSTVALAVAAMAKARGWRVWWVTATDTASVTGGMLEVLRELGAPESVTAPVREGAPTAPGRAWGFLNSAHAADGRWLLVFDGADRPAVLAAAGTLTPADGTGWLRPDPLGMVIVTTRNRDPRVWGTRVALRELRPLDPASAAGVLTDLAPGAADPAGGRQARDLARRLGGLPLALHLAGAYLGSPFARWASFDEYHKALDGVELPAALTDIEEPGADARATIQRTWDLSLDALAADGRPQARPILLVLSCYAPATPIPAALLQPWPLAGLLGPGAQDTAGDAGDEQEAERLRRLRDGLTGLSSTGLIDIGASSGPAGANAITVHPVVADVNRARLLTLDRADRAAVFGVAVALLAAATAGLDAASPADWPAWRLLVPHVTTALELLSAELDSAALGRLLTAGAVSTDALLRGGRLAAAAKLAQAGVRAAQFTGPDDPASLTARASLAQALDRQGRSGEAEQLHRELLSDKSRVLGEQDPDTLATRFDLAQSIGLQGRYRTADELYRGLLADQRRVLSADHPDTLATRHNLARMIGRQGRYAEAERACGEVLADRLRVLGADHPDTLATRHSLARVVGLQGRYAAAEKLYREVLTDRQRVLGTDHPDTLATRHRLARMVGLQGRYAEAEDLCRQVLAHRHRVLGEEHRDNLATWHRLARLAGLQGRYAEGERMLRQVLAERRRMLGTVHPDTLASGHRLARLIGQQGRYGEAEELAGQVLGDRRQVLGDDHPDTLDARDTLAWLTGLRGRHGQAEEQYRQVLADRERILGVAHPDTLATGCDLARIVGLQGRRFAAERLCHEVLGAQRRVLGDEHPDTLTSRATLAWLAGLLGRGAEAEQLYRQVLEARRRVLGAGHPDTVATAGELARLVAGTEPAPGG
jgi:CRP-like cAMP-binding protein